MNISSRITQEEIIQAITLPTSLGEWLYQNQNIFLEYQQKKRRINWNALAALLAAKGIMDQKGNPPSVNTLKCAWYRIRNREKVKDKISGSKEIRTIQSLPDIQPSQSYEKSHPRRALARLKE